MLGGVFQGHQMKAVIHPPDFTDRLARQGIPEDFQGFVLIRRAHLVKVVQAIVAPRQAAAEAQEVMVPGIVLVASFGGGLAITWVAPVARHPRQGAPWLAWKIMSTAGIGDGFMAAGGCIDLFEAGQGRSRKRSQNATRRCRRWAGPRSCFHRRECSSGTALRRHCPDAG